MQFGRSLQAQPAAADQPPGIRSCPTHTGDAEYRGCAVLRLGTAVTAELAPTRSESRPGLTRIWAQLMSWVRVTVRRSGAGSH
jgi:hypothetical protein